MGSGRARRGLIALFLTLAYTFPAFAACSDTSVELRNGPDVARFNVEIANTDATRAKGLMNREKMAASSAMLFVYDAPRHATFWMKNTLIPLDMIFVDSTGLVTRVHHRAEPLDETTIDGGEGVEFVLEVNGGLAKRLGIKPGSVLRHPAIEQTAAVWACGSD